MLKRTDKNAYEIELPEDYEISLSFNLADLSPYHNNVDGTNKDLRTSLFHPGEIDTGVHNLLISSCGSC